MDDFTSALKKKDEKRNWILLDQDRIQRRNRFSWKRTFRFHNRFVPDFKQNKKKKTNNYSIFPRPVSSLVAKNPAMLYEKCCLLKLFPYDSTLGVIRALQTDVHHARPTDNKISLLAITWHKGRWFKSEVTSLHLLAATPYVLFTPQW